MQPIDPKIAEKLKKIRVLISDVDGVMTDGGLMFFDQETEAKVFYSKDGVGLMIWHLAGYRSALITARHSEALLKRAREVHVDTVVMKKLNKLSSTQEAVAEFGATAEETLFVGDDLVDLAAMRWVGVTAAPSDAVEDILDMADFVTERPGGRGALREVIEAVLRSQGRWEDLVEQFAAGP